MVIIHINIFNVINVHILSDQNHIKLYRFLFPHSILTLNTNTSFCLTCHHLLMRIINIIMRDRSMRKPEASLRPALVPFNAGMLIVPVYSFSQLIYYCSWDVILKPEQKVVIPRFSNECLH